ncbi:hypothetical protein PRUPE_6G082900 [Prunus persica]|uniref:Regulatory protein RecX n=1 Tax=Prunus persica TaxID=3760 RepID=A0A251NLZ6_PRUPE|nr:hypothetical protein PRUPE_6G082900 [Prunus persica]
MDYGIPWNFFRAREKIAITCLKSRGYSSSLLIRYIPKKSSQVKMSENYQQTEAFTAVELRKKLHGNNFTLDTVEAVINDFISRGLINDSLYAEAFSCSRWSSLSWGPYYFSALFSKGVSKLDAENAIKLVFEEGESDNDQKLVHGLSKLSMDNLLVQASKQWLRGQEVPKETRKSRIVHWLQYRGFSWDVIGFVLKKLESQYPP